MGCRIRSLKPSENDVQAVIVQGLRAHGFIVQITTRRVKRCRNCGRWPQSGGDGCTKGIADLLLRGRNWPRGICLALEVKKPGPIKWSSTEQRLAEHCGDIIVVQSLDEAMNWANAMGGRFAGE